MWRLNSYKKYVKSIIILNNYEKYATKVGST